MLQIAYTFFGEFFRMQAQGVQVKRSVSYGVARRLGARRNIAIHLMRPPYKRIGPHLIALLYRGNATYSSILANTYMSAQLAGIRYNDALSNVAIVSDVRIRHHQYFICNTSAASALNRAAIQCTVFANGTALAYFKSSRFTRIL